jgi:oligoribonuclease NrnB/cAMP/cGMP phosphodiesterase (DHH superfamily)
MLQPDEVNVVIYHSPCTDGYGSRLCAEKYLKSKFPDRIVDYYPMTIGSPPPEGLEGKNVLICDYSYKKDILKDLLTKVNKLLIIDHHKSSEKDLLEIDDKYKIFSMDHSGAMLTWKYFYPNITTPLLIDYIQDRDIWTKKLPHTDDFAYWFYTIPYDFEVYNKYLENDVLLLEMIKTKGIAYGELNNINVLSSIDYANVKFCKIKDSYYFIAYLNSSVLKSDIGNKIFNKFPLIDFSAVYSINDFDDSTSFSLRSTNKHTDVSVISSSLGGGGHRNASGVKVDYVTNQLPSKIIDSGNLYKQLQSIYFGKLTINDRQYNVVYMNSTIYQYELGCYLLRDKYDNVQACKDIFLKLGKNDHLDNVKLACIWSYDPVNNISKYTIVKHKSIDVEETKNINEYYDTDKVIVYKGLHKTLAVGCLDLLKIT